MGNEKVLDMVALTLLVIGGIAWGLHAFYIDPVDMLFKAWARWVYGLVGIAAAYRIYRVFK